MIKRIGSIIQSRLPVQESKLEEAALQAIKQSTRIGEILLEQGLLTEREFYEALAEQFSMEFVPEIENLISTELLREFSPDTLKSGNVLPLDSSDTLLRLAITDPLDFDTILQLELISDRTVEAVLTTPSQMKKMLQKLFEGDSAFKQFTGKISREYEKQLQIDESLSIEEIRQRTEAEPVVRMVSLIFNEAIKLNASDIHIEPSESNAVIRLRIDGMLQQYSEISRWMYSPLTSRIKILADLDIAEKRVPQDGRIRHNVGAQAYDFRVSTLPTHYGEKTVIRILKHDKALLDINNLGIPAPALNSLSQIIEKPQGMIFVTGPTGSGKSSTLFACLNRIRHKAINITTIENPIEYKLDGVNQVQINEKAGVTFAAVLRSILRQDPDVILVGEIRDTETAQIAVQASQTGHLVFSTLHTNDAVSAITRLRDLKIPSFLISSSLLAIIAQRLVRVLCPHCKKEAEISGETRRKWESLLGSYSIPRSYTAEGCERCKKTGYKGRIGIFELIEINEKIRSLIADDISDSALRKSLRDEGFSSLINDGISKIEQGITTPEELLRVVLVEDIR
ncbi:MAG TPA: ATPase, T2SS/T4P/T4SS family [Chitinispirillaceae bacterium]|jgi:type IV pilus assembly protein PilB|nr:ATPase, T2SS/T4P/T4SS family [Chitinispirillaceae bacterium]